jgi:hypothetical protein
MTDDATTEILSHRTIYFPWTDGLGYPDDPVKFTIALAHRAQLPITVICHSKTDIPDTLSRAEYITHRSSNVSGRPSVALLLYPDRKTVGRAPTRSAKYLVAAEYPVQLLRTWAAKRGAWDIRNGESMELNLDPNVKALYDRILWNGNNSWRDAPGKRDALRDLHQLRELGALDKEELLGYLMDEKRSDSLEQLEKLIDKAMSG